jgi:trans-aconitate 2-methyltransferase
VRQCAGQPGQTEKQRIASKLVDLPESRDGEDLQSQRRQQRGGREALIIGKPERRQCLAKPRSWLAHEWDSNGYTASITYPPETVLRIHGDQMRPEDGAAQPTEPRTELVHELLAPTSRLLLSREVSSPPGLAIDLGCGPGVSTRFLAEVTAARLVAGLDVSARWVALAERFRSERMRFFVHDVSRVPFPVGPAELLYSRLLLIHLPDPDSALAGWATQLRPGGQLLLEEVECIETTQPAFRRYLELVGQIAAYEGKALYIGPRLNELDVVDGLVRTTSSVLRIPVENTVAARIFGSNLQNWKTHLLVQAGQARAQLETLELDLFHLAQQPRAGLDTEWSVRQVVYRSTR